MGLFLTWALLHYQRNKKASPCVSSSIPVPGSGGVPASAPAASEFISQLHHVSCTSISFYIFSPLGVTLLQDFFRDNPTFLHLPNGTAGSCWAEPGHPHGCAGLCLQASWQHCPSLADLSLWALLWANLPWSSHPDHGTLCAPALPSVCPSRGPSVQDCVHLPHGSALLAIWSYHHKPPRYHLTQDLLLTAQRSVPAFCFENLQPCTWYTPGCSRPGHSCTNSSLAEPALWSHTVCFPSARATTKPGLTSLHTFGRLTLSHSASGNYCLFLTFLP